MVRSAPLPILATKSLKNFTGAEFYKLGSTVCNHVLHGFSPAYGAVRLSNQVSLDFDWVGMRQSVDILVDGTLGSVNRSILDCCCELGTCRFHAGAVESASDFKFECAFCAGFCGFCASCVDSLLFPLRLRVGRGRL